MAFALTITFLYGDVHDKPRWSTGRKTQEPFGIEAWTIHSGKNYTPDHLVKDVLIHVKIQSPKSLSHQVKAQDWFYISNS